MMGEAIHVLDQPGGMQLFDRRHNASVKGPPSVLEEARIRDLVAQGVLECEFRSEEHTSELQSQSNLVCRLLLEKKKKIAHQFEQLCHWQNAWPICNASACNLIAARRVG